MTIPLDGGEPLPYEIQELAQAENQSLLQNADVPDEEKSEIDAAVVRVAEEREDAAGDASPP
jgi:hypothetical protein